MTRLSLLVLLLLGVALSSACGDEDSGGNSSPVSEDAGEDAASEPDASEPDAAEPDAAEPDAAEPDAGPPCEEPPTCASDAACGPGEICAHQTCIVPAPPQAYVIAAPLRRVTRYGFGTPGNVTRRDVNGDGRTENFIGALVSAFPFELEEMQRALELLMASGRFDLFTEVIVDPEYCGGTPDTQAARAVMHLGTRDLDGDGLADEGGAARLRGSSFDGERGPRCVFPKGAMDDAGRVVASADGPCQLTVPLSGLTVSIPVDGLVLELPSASQKVDEDAVVSGYVRLSEIVEESNRSFAGCACAGIDPTRPVLELVEDAEGLHVACLQEPVLPNDCDLFDNTACDNINNLCTSLDLVGRGADIASGEHGEVKDAFSVVMELGLEPAEMAEPPVTPALQAFGDRYEFQPFLDWNGALRDTVVDVLVNDEYDPARHSLQSVEVDPPMEGVTARIEGGAIRVTVDPALPATGQLIVSLRYTLGDGADESSTAPVVIRLEARTAPPTTQPDTLRVVLPSAPVELDVRANDAHPTGWLEVKGVSGSALGTLEVLEQIRVRFTPERAGEETVVYTVVAETPRGSESLPVEEALHLVVECAPDHYGPTCLPCDCGEELCADGASGDGSCTPPDPCGELICDAHASCVEEAPGVAVCVCDDGWQGDGAQCEDINECELGLCDGRACANTPGGYTCAACPDSQGGLLEFELDAQAQEVEGVEYRLMGRELYGNFSLWTDLASYTTSLGEFTVDSTGFGVFPFAGWEAQAVYRADGSAVRFEEQGAYGALFFSPGLFGAQSGEPETVETRVEFFSQASDLLGPGWRYMVGVGSAERGEVYGPWSVTFNTPLEPLGAARTGIDGPTPRYVSPSTVEGDGLSQGAPYRFFLLPADASLIEIRATSTAAKLTVLVGLAEVPTCD